MIDPVTAFAVAQVAIKGIQSAIKMGKDINSIVGDVVKFMDAKDAVVASKSNAKSDTGKALEIVMQAKKLADQEKAMKELLIYSGNGDVWTAMLLERNKIRHQRLRETIEVERKRRAVATEINELVTFILWALIVVALLVLVFWFTLEFTKYQI